MVRAFNRNIYFFESINRFFSDLRTNVNCAIIKITSFIKGVGTRVIFEIKILYLRTDEKSPAFVLKFQQVTF